MNKPLAKALCQQEKAETNVAVTLRSEYPIGSSISWSRNGVHDGVVVSHGYKDSIKVRNTHTGNEVFIYAAIIVE